MTNFAHRMAISSIRIRLFLLVMVAVLCFTSNASAKFVLVIDAGHGGRDAGAVGKVAKEKNINLNVALSFGRMVEQQLVSASLVEQLLVSASLAVQLLESASLVEQQQVRL